jgi:serine phosphatase RsbU (regulator of sigma subunit)/CHASE1-domain containing sensor protein
MAGGISEQTPTRRRLRLARLLIVASVVALGIAATLLAWHRSDTDVDRRDAMAARRATDLVEDLVGSTQAGLAGVAGVVQPDGSVDLRSFRAYGGGVVAATTLEALAYEPVVPAAGRAAFEASIGRPMIDRPSAGAARAPDRPLHYPVLEVVPVTDANRGVLGFDIASDPVRREAAEQARDRGTVVFSQPVPSQPSGRQSFFLVKALYRPAVPISTVAERRAALVGFVSTAYGADVLANDLAADLPRGTSFEVWDGRTQLARHGSSDRQGRTTTTSATGRTWTLTVASGGAPSRSLALGSAATTLALLAGLALFLHRTSRYEAQVARAARHVQSLAAFASGLAGRSTSDDVMTYLTAGVLAPLDAFHAAVGVVDGDRLQRYFTPGALTASVAAVLPAANPLSAHTPLTEAAREDIAVLLPSTAAMQERYPQLAEAWIAAGFQATANLPLHDRQGAVIGALGIAWDRPVELDADLLDRLTTVAGIAGQSLERAQLADAEHRVVGALQTNVLAPLPEVPELACAARYLPAASSVGMGGDWFEGMVLDDGRYVVVVGDVAGHGIGAVAQMAQFRSMIGTLVRLGTPLRDLVELASRSVERTGRIATAVVVAIDAKAGTLEYVAAGHPPPILRLANGTTVVLREGRRPLIGVTRPSEDSGIHDFPIGASLLCYTDGLIERRSEAIDQSVRHLAERFAAVPAGDPERMADDLLATSLTAREQADDVALAVISRRA